MPRSLQFGVVVAWCVAWSGLLASAGQNELTKEEQAAGWKLLFDGKTTKGWRSFAKSTFPEKGWVVNDGVLELIGKSKAGDILSEKTFSDFDLTWEWKVEKGGNNGLKYLVRENSKDVIAHEYQMLDDANGRDKGNKHSTASFYDVLPPDTSGALKPSGEWNQSRVLVDGNHVEHWLNGKKVLQYELGSPEVLAAVQKSKFRQILGYGNKVRGHILLTYHTDPVQYRNIKILDLAARKTSK